MPSRPPMSTAENRRRHARVSMTEPVLVFKGNKPIGEFKTRNISAGGALITGKHDLALGDVIDASLRFAERMSVRFRGTVVRVGRLVDEQYFAVAFIDLDPAVEDTIQSAVAAAQAKARHASAMILSDMVASRSDLEL